MVTKGSRPAVPGLLRHPTTFARSLPLPAGEGWGEGERRR